LFFVEGVYSKAQEDLRAPPPREGGGLIIEAIRIAFVVHAVEAVGADHGILIAQAVEGGARKRTRCGTRVAAIELLVTDEGGSGEGRG
jgi:hypothetical protein